MSSARDELLDLILEDPCCDMRTDGEALRKAEANAAIDAFAREVNAGCDRCGNQEAWEVRENGTVLCVPCALTEETDYREWDDRR